MRTGAAGGCWGGGEGREAEEDPTQWGSCASVKPLQSLSRPSVHDVSMAWLGRQMPTVAEAGAVLVSLVERNVLRGRGCKGEGGRTVRGWEGAGAGRCSRTRAGS